MNGWRRRNRLRSNSRKREGRETSGWNGNKIQKMNRIVGT